MRPSRLLPPLVLLLAMCRTAPPPADPVAVPAGAEIPLAPNVTLPPPEPTVTPEEIGQIHELRQRPDVAAALAFVASDRVTTLAQWRVLSEIPAPSGHEERRAAFIEALLQEMGLTVRRDRAGNVLATRPGQGSGPHVVLDAHLDTVFPLTTDVTTRVEDGRIYGPGVGDDTRNIAGILAVIRAMSAGGVLTEGDVTFLFTVSEETDFRGIERFLADHAGTIGRFIALDGGYGSFTYAGTGTYWYRYHILGPGGHTRSSRRLVSATRPLARAIDRIYDLPLPPAASLNIGMLGGSDVINAKAEDAWFSLDIRSTVAEELQQLDLETERIVREEAARAGMTVRQEVLSRETVAAIPGHRTSPMVRTTEAVFRAFGFEPRIGDGASNHSSAALRAGVPAISTGLTPCDRTHSLDEHCEIEPLFTGIQRTIVLLVALARE